MVEAIDYEWFPIFLATLLYWVIGFIWYSRWLFGFASPIRSTIKSASAYLLSGGLIAFFLFFFEGYLYITTATDGAFMAFCLWLGFILPTQLASMLRTHQPLSHFYVHTSYHLFTLVAMASLLAA